MSTRIKSLFLFLACFAPGMVAVAAGTDIVSVAPTSVKLGTTFTHISGGLSFTWVVKCGGGDCQYGQFIGGEYWIAPKTPGEQILLISVSPAGEENGVEINPIDNTKQGFLSCAATIPTHIPYDPARNVMNALPKVLTPNSSVVKAYRAPSTLCKEVRSKGCCVASNDILTVLDKPLPDGGASYFRPGFAGNIKTLYRLDDFDFSKVSRDVFMTPLTKSEYVGIGSKWHTPFVDHYFEHGPAQYSRAFAPQAVLPDYGAEQNAHYMTDIFYGALANDTPQNKLPALTGLIQRGLDLYASWKNGITWPGGAGQSMGRKPPMVFFAALVKDATVRSDVMSMKKLHPNATQEDSQIKIGVTGVPLWGTPAPYAGRYWSELLAYHNYAGSPLPPANGGGNKAYEDPYHYIDGPAGLPGTFYMACCSTGGFIAYSIAQNLMPAMCEASNDPVLHQYIKRVLTKGIHTQPDECAPPDPREVATCAPYKAVTGCLYYGKTWGPDPKAPSQCIKNGPGQNGRFPARHGFMMPDIYNEPNISKSIREHYGMTLFDRCLLPSSTPPPPASPPSITTQPANQSVTVGATATFSVVANGAVPLSYQWRKNGTNIAGATTASYTTPATIMNDNGAAYSVIVSNSDGSVTSANAMLTVKETTPIVSGLVAYWKLDETTGTVASDSGTFGNAGTLVNGPVWTTGNVGGALSFDGVDDYVSMGTTGFPTGNNSVTLCGWFNVLKIPSAFPNLLEYGPNTANTTPTLNGSPWPKVRFSLSNGTGVVDSASSMSLNKWFHACGVYNTTQTKIYLNGVLEGTANYSAANISVSGGALMGKFNGLSGNFFSMLADEVRIYNRALTADEVMSLYQDGNHTANSNQNSFLTKGLVGMWSFNGQDVTDKIYDRSGQNNNGYFGTSTATTSAKIMGKVGQALSFDGVDDYAEAADSASLDQSSSYTVSAWVKANSLHRTDTSQWDSIVGKGQNGETAPDNHNYLLGYNALSGFGTVDRWLFVLENSAGTNCNVVGNAAANLNQWYHVAGVFDDAGNTVKIYVNGAEQGSTACALTPNTNALPVRIGDDMATAGLPWNGIIDEVRIYNRVLTADEVASLWQAGR